MGRNVEFSKKHHSRGDRPSDHGSPVDKDLVSLSIHTEDEVRMLKRRQEVKSEECGKARRPDRGYGRLEGWRHRIAAGQVVPVDRLRSRERYAGGGADVADTGPNRVGAAARCWGR